MHFFRSTYIQYFEFFFRTEKRRVKGCYDDMGLMSLEMRPKDKSGEEKVEKSPPLPKTPFLGPFKAWQSTVRSLNRGFLPHFPVRRDTPDEREREDEDEDEMEKAPFYVSYVSKAYSEEECS